MTYRVIILLVLCSIFLYAENDIIIMQTSRTLDYDYFFLDSGLSDMHEYGISIPKKTQNYIKENMPFYNINGTSASCNNSGVIVKKRFSKSSFKTIRLQTGINSPLLKRAIFL